MRHKHSSQAHLKAQATEEGEEEEQGRHMVHSDKAILCQGLYRTAATNSTTTTRGSALQKALSSSCTATYLNPIY